MVAIQVAVGEGMVMVVDIINSNIPLPMTVVVAVERVKDSRRDTMATSHLPLHRWVDKVKVQGHHHQAEEGEVVGVVAAPPSPPPPSRARGTVAARARARARVRGQRRDTDTGQATDPPVILIPAVTLVLPLVGEEEERVVGVGCHWVWWVCPAWPWSRARRRTART